MLKPSPGGYWRRPASALVALVMASLGAGLLLRLPALAHQYGGLPFVLTYLVVVALVAWPVLTAELSVGRLVRQDLFGGLREDIERNGGSRLWQVMPALYVLVALVLLSWYAVVTGWMLAFVPRALSGALTHEGQEAAKPFLALAQDAERSLAWHTMVMVLVATVVARGLRPGIERFTQVLAVVAVAMLLFLWLVAARTGEVAPALTLWLATDWAAFGWRGALEAARQALFTAAVGLGGVLAYGGHIAERASLFRLSAAVLSVMVLAALVGATLLQAVVGGAWASGGGALATLFETLVARSAEQNWRWTPAAVYALFAVLALGSLVALLELLVQGLIARWRYTRIRAAFVAACFVWALGIVSVLTFGSSMALEVGGRSVFALLQTTVAQVGAPLVLLILVIYVGRVWSRLEMQQAFFNAPAEAGLTRRALVLRFALVYPVRIVVLPVLLYSWGLIDKVFGFWGL